MTNDTYALAYSSLDELNEDTSAPASNDFTLRFDASAASFKKVDASDLTATIGTTATKAELNYLDITTLGTGAASKAVVLDATANYALPTLHTFRSGIVTLTATDAITALEHSNRIILVTGTATAAYTLPEATGTGDKYTFYIGEVNTNGLTFVTPDLVNSLLYGKIANLDVDSTAATAFFTVTAGDTNTVTFDGLGKGGQIGDTLEFVDLATDVWSIDGEVRCIAGQSVASPFSAA